MFSRTWEKRVKELRYGLLLPNLYGLIEVAKKRVQPEGEIVQNTIKSVPEKNSKENGTVYR